MMRAGTAAAIGRGATPSAQSQQACTGARYSPHMNDEKFVADVLARAGAEAEPERVSAAYADERIAQKIERFAEPKQREGLEELNATLRDRDVPPGVRLHLISAVAHLSRIAEGTLGERHERSGRP